MDNPSSSALLASELGAYCGTEAFGPGDRLVDAGNHYHRMYWLTEGRVEARLEPASKVHALGAGSPVGEISFLKGCPATGTVTAQSAVSALVIDDETLARIEDRKPALAARLMQHLAEVAEDRMSANLVFNAGLARQGAGDGEDAVEVHLCRSEEMIRKAQELRYAVYCGELGRDSPNADHERGIIADELDSFGHTFIAVRGGQTIGTLRANLASQGQLGAVAEIYGMTASPHHPSRTGICTKFVIGRKDRGGPAAMELIAAVVRFGLRHDARECYIDCIPALLHYYRALGFKITGPKFMHRENGPSFPMFLDVARHGQRLSQGLGRVGFLRLYLTAQAIKRWEAIKWWERTGTA